MQAVNSGDLLLSLVFKSKSKILEGIILKLANLKREQDVAIGLAGIIILVQIIKICLYVDSQENLRTKSACKRKGVTVDGVLMCGPLANDGRCQMDTTDSKKTCTLHIPIYQPALLEKLCRICLIWSIIA